MPDAMTPYMGAMEPFRGDSRRAARAISRMEGQTQVRLASIDKETDATITKVSSLKSVTATGMIDVAQVAKLESDLETMAPGASGRLAMLADFHVMGVASVMADHERALRRR